MKNIKRLGLTQAVMTQLEPQLYRAIGKAEICGFLFGSIIGPDTALVSRVQATPNLADTPFGFSITAREFWEAKDRYVAEGAQLLGIYHSHPFPSVRPSEQDWMIPKMTQLLSLILAFQGDCIRVACHGLIHNQVTAIQVIAPYA